MATSNFKYLKHFDILAMDDIDDSTDEFDYDFYYMIDDDLYEYNKKLNFFKLTIKSGYYSGIQIVPTLLPITEDVLDYYDSLNGKDIFAEYGYNKYILKLKILKEIEYINTTIFNKLKDNYNFKRLGIVARFSNGETMYGEI